VSSAPPSHASPVIPVVLHTTNFTVSESVESEEVELQVTVCPGFLGASLLTALKLGAWLTSKGVPESPLPPSPGVEHAAALPPSQTKAYQAFETASPTKAVRLQDASWVLAVALLVHQVVATQIGS
jgi:hypothetical protein